jgi:hypothetical protein
VSALSFRTAVTKATADGSVLLEVVFNVALQMPKNVVAGGGLAAVR